MSDGSESERKAIVVNRPRLIAVLAIETFGIGLLLWGLLEVYVLGGNPVSPDVLVPLGSLVLASGSVWFAKVYDGPGLLGFGKD